jgi:3-hydroxyacyl-CoA dehydrogenase / enoyl-CoA hydratase / 3-hydroxybutyryl-CoA epimerase
MIHYNIENNVAVLQFEVSNQPMNVLNSESITAFAEALEKAYNDTTLKGIIITSARPEFVAGADLKMLLQNNEQGAKILMDACTTLHGIFRRMETNGKPIVAAINGTALGGGFEICLACHHRIALNNPKTKLGLPEVKIGLLPGAGGTQRLPRLIGMEAAAPLILEGKDSSPQTALRLGLIHEIAETPEEMMQKAFDWIEKNPTALQPWDELDKKGNIRAKDNYKIPGGGVQTPKGMQLFMAGTALMMDKTKGNYPAPLAIMACFYEGLQVNMDKAIRIETRHFVTLAKSIVAKNLIQTMFFGLNEVNKGISRPKDQPKTDVKKLGILGAGMMGAGIAYASAMVGIEVVLKDVSIEAAEKGKAYSVNLLEKAIAKGRSDKAKADAILGLIKTTDQVADLADCDLIIEAVFENQRLKATVTQEAEPMLRKDGVFASNTSTIPITLLAGASAQPDNFIGIHFFSPVDKMQLVEIIVGKQTSDYALATAIDYVRKIRKTPIVVNDSRGFYTSRCFSTYTHEGMALLQDGVNPVLIENAARNAGMPVGPLAVTDEVALDLALKIATETIKSGMMTEDDLGYQIPKKFVEMGRLGKKSKAGFYAYPEGGKKYLWEGLSEVFPQAASQPTEEEVQKRLLYRQALESVKCWEEGVLRSKLEGDIGSIFAWGFPPYLGGTLSFVDTVGINTFVAECNRLADAYGERFRPTERLRKHIE